MPRTRRPLQASVTVAVLSAALALSGTGAAPALGDSGHGEGGHYTVKTATSRGTGGAVTSVDPEASKIGLQVLKRGGNAADAIISMAAGLGVTEPYSSGIGGGGYLLYYDARQHRVSSIDGRETAPQTMPRDAFIDPSTGKPYNFTPQLVTSGVSVGTPGSAATWALALRKWGSIGFARALKPATKLAERGFVVDDTFRQQTLDNKVRFDAFNSTRRLFLRGGDAPAVGSVFRNPDLAATYRMLAKRGVDGFYTGPLAREIARTAQHPPKRSDTDLPVPAGYLQRSDLARYQPLVQKPTHVGYRGLDVYGIAPSSSGGTTVGEALNILERFDVKQMSDSEALHHYLEAAALAFADRAAYVGDPAFVDVPTHQLLSDRFAKQRACLISPTTSLPKPVAAGDVTRGGSCQAATGTKAVDTENINTTNLTATDRWGNVAEYTLTIEQTGGSGMVVPGRGFLLNNELTDFSPVYDPKDPNRIEAGKRPRSSISPTIVLKRAKPWLALGSPGGSTIITTVLQILFNRIDRGMSLPAAIAAPRAAPNNMPTIAAEQSFIDAYNDVLTPYGDKLVPVGAPGTSAAEIGAATAIAFHRHGRLVAASEPVRRGGGSALVVHPDR